jgi:hypothetical protein
MVYLAPHRRPGIRASGAGGAMGDIGGDATVSDLVAQVNRFGQTAPSGYQFVTDPFTAPPAMFGISLLPMNIGLATTALTIYQRRATDAYNQFHDVGSQQAITAANAGFADPVGFVTGRLTDVTRTLQALADSLGIPPAAGGVVTDTGLSSGTILLAAGILAAWWLMEPKR